MLTAKVSNCIYICCHVEMPYIGSKKLYLVMSVENFLLMQNDCERDCFVEES